MAELPSGTVTFLFTDVEGSTRLLKQLRDEYESVLTAYERLLRAAFAEAGGEVIDTQGDAFFVAFRRAKDAVGAAVAAQRRLAEHVWPEGAAVRVRMGIHSGEPSVAAERYIGLGVHRAARIMAAGHGGQVLLSNATRELIEDDLPRDVGLRDLGEHRLKDLDRPERIFQLEIGDLPSEFPPIRTLDPPPTNATLFAGRESELAEAAQAAVARPALRRRRGLLAAALIGVLAAAAAIPIFALGRGNSGTREGTGPAAGNSVAIIDGATNRLIPGVGVGRVPDAVVAGDGFVWVTNRADRTVSRIDPRTLETRTIGLPARPGWSALGGGVLWIGHPLRGSVSRLPTKELVLRGEINLAMPGGVQPFVGGLAVGAGSVWAVTETLGHEGLSRIDPATREVVARIPLGPSSEAGGIVAVGAGAVWVTGVEGYVVRVDPATNRVVATIPVAGNTWVAVGSGAVWVTVNRENTVWKIDPATNLAIKSITVGEGPRTVEVGAGSVWVASFRNGTVARVDPETDRVVKTIRITPPARSQNPRGPAGIAIEHERVWVTVPRFIQFE